MALVNLLANIMFLFLFNLLINLEGIILKQNIDDDLLSCYEISSIAIYESIALGKD